MNLLFCNHCRAYRQHKAEKYSTQVYCTSCKAIEREEKKKNLKLHQILENNFSQELIATLNDSKKQLKRNAIVSTENKVEEKTQLSTIVHENDSTLISIFLFSVSLTIFLNLLSF